jgi:ectoine hydroxylase-related dioxygenase (phytanoyl-CoA dioxygenase family)
MNHLACTFVVMVLVRSERGRGVRRYMYPCNEQGGAGAVVPGSHLLPDAPGQTLNIPMGSGYNRSYGQNELPHSKMVNHVCADVDAGDCMIFDTAIWHTGLANSSERPRCTVTLSWACSKTRPNPVSPHTTHACLHADAYGLHDGWCLSRQTLSEAAVARMEERDGPTCLRRKRLFGIPDEALPQQAR